MTASSFGSLDQRSDLRLTISLPTTRQQCLTLRPVTAILTTLLGGLLAIAGGLVGIAFTDRRDRNRWLRDSQLQASTELITAVQLLVRRMINVAYLDPAESGSYDLQEFAKRRPQNPRAAAVMAAFDDATAEWNSARHKALLVTPPRLAEKIPELDNEVDRLLDSAHAQIWTRAEFRQQESDWAGWRRTTLSSPAASPDCPTSN